MPIENQTTADYDGQHTIIVGDVNTGKTRLTETILTAWTRQGKTRTIVPPRLRARTEEEADDLAATNARTIENLFQELFAVDRTILVINDVTLYLQAGNYDRLRELIQPIRTVLINAYYGHSFPDYRLSRRERRLTDRLIGECQRVIRLP